MLYNRDSVGDSVASLAKRLRFYGLDLAAVTAAACAIIDELGDCVIEDQLDNMVYDIFDNSPSTCIDPSMVNNQGYEAQISCIALCYAPDYDECRRDIQKAINEGTYFA